MADSAPNHDEGGRSSASAVRRVVGALAFHAPSLAILFLAVEAILASSLPLSECATTYFLGDAAHNIYLLNWGQHVVWTRPWEFFQAPIFHPLPDGGAYSSMAPLLCLLSAPFRVFDNPVLSFNLAFHLGVVLTAFAMYGVLWSVSRHRRASVLGAVVFAANGDILWHFAGHPNLVAPMMVAVALWAYAWTRDVGRRSLWGLGLALGAAFLTDFYLGFIVAIGLGAAWLVDLARSGRYMPARALLAAERRTVIALALGLALGAYLAGPHRRVAERQGQMRGIGEVLRGSADPAGYLLPSTWSYRSETGLGRIIHSALPFEPWEENAQFFGYSAWVLAAAALVGSVGRWRRRELARDDRFLLRMALIGMVGFVLSLGPFLRIGPWITDIRLPFYWLYAYVPPLRFMRAIARFAVLVSVFVAVGACLGAARMAWFNHPDRAYRHLVFAVLLAILILEFSPVSTTPRTLRDVAAYEAIERHREFDIVSPLPFGDERALLALAGRFPATPSGIQTAGRNHRYGALRHLFGVLFGIDAKLPLLRALDAQALLVVGDDQCAEADGSTSLTLVERWPGGGLYRIDEVDDPAIATHRTRLADLRERNPLPSFDPFPPSGPAMRRIDVRRADESSALPFEYVYDTTLEPLEIAMTPPIRLEHVGRISVEMAVENLGTSFTEARLQWRDSADTRWLDARMAGAVARSDGQGEVVTFDLTKSGPAWRPERDLVEVRLYFALWPYPGQRARLDEMRFYPPEEPEVPEDVTAPSADALPPARPAE